MSENVNCQDLFLKSIRCVISPIRGHWDWLQDQTSSLWLIELFSWSYLGCVCQTRREMKLKEVTCNSLTIGVAWIQILTHSYFHGTGYNHIIDHVQQNTQILHPLLHELLVNSVYKDKHGNVPLFLTSSITQSSIQTDTKI